MVLRLQHSLTHSLKNLALIFFWCVLMEHHTRMEVNHGLSLRRRGLNLGRPSVYWRLNHSLVRVLCCCEGRKEKRAHKLPRTHDVASSSLGGRSQTKNSERWWKACWSGYVYTSVILFAEVRANVTVPHTFLSLSPTLVSTGSGFHSCCYLVHPGVKERVKSNAVNHSSTSYRGKTSKLLGRGGSSRHLTFIQKPPSKFSHPRHLSLFLHRPSLLGKGEGRCWAR